MAPLSGARANTPAVRTSDAVPSWMGGSAGATDARRDRSAPRGAYRPAASRHETRRGAAARHDAYLAGRDEPAAPAAGPRRLPALDGLRALAIAAVIAYHLGVPWLPSGHMGVVVFLVLTGYLATCSLMRALERDGANPLQAITRFWRRRLRRLWPAMAIVVVLVTALCTLFNHVLLTKLRPDFIPALAFASNISDVLRGTSYFGQIGGPSPLTHLWYLGVSEQFCLVLPLLCLLAHRRGGRVAQVASVCAALASALLMALLYVPNTDPTRVYYGPDTRAFAPLLGVWLALAWPLGARPGTTLDTLASKGAAGMGGLVALVALVAVMVLVPDTSPLLYRGGMALVAVLATTLVASLLSPSSPLGRVCATRPLTWLGARSYSIYLWHYPIIQLLGAGRANTPWWLSVIAVAISLVVAEASYRLIERSGTTTSPTRQQQASPARRSRRTSRASRAASRATTAPAALLALALPCLVAVVGLVAVPDTTLVPEDAIKSTGESVDAARDLSAEVMDSPAESDPTEGETSTASTTPAAEVDLDATTTLRESDADVAAGLYSPVLIGDSVPGDAEWNATFPNVLSDCYIGRMPEQAISVYEGYAAQNVVGHVVVFAVFSNTTPSMEQLGRMVSAVGANRELFLVGTVNSDGFQDAANANLVAAADTYGNVHYVDWPAVCSGHEAEYLWGDGTHLRPEGAVVYVDTIRRAVAQAMVDAGGTAA